jgi:hypothetical protein
LAPIVEVIGVASGGDLSVQRIRAGKRAALSGINAVSPATAGHFSLALPDGHHGRDPVCTGLNTVLARLRNGKRLIRRIYFENFVAAQPAHPEIERSLRELYLHCAVVQVEKGKASIGIQANDRRTNLHLRA